MWFIVLQLLLPNFGISFPPLVIESGFVFSSVSCLLNMPPPCSTNNSLAAGVLASQSSDVLVIVASTASGFPSSSLSADSITEAVVRAIGSSPPAILSSIQVNAHSLPASNSSASSVALNAVVLSQSYPSSVVSSSVASSQVSVAGIASSPGTFTFCRHLFLLSPQCLTSPALAQPASWLRFLLHFPLPACRAVYHPPGPQPRSTSLRGPLPLVQVMPQSRESWLKRLLMASSWSWRTCCR